MSINRLTISLSEARHRALKEAAAKRGKTIGQIIDESLELYGIKSQDDARSLIERARRKAALSAGDAMAVALTEGARGPRRKAA